MPTYSWKTGSSGDWGLPNNWIGGVPNGPQADVTISAAGQYVVTIATPESFTAGTATLDDGTAILKLAGTLDLAGSLAGFTLDAGKLDLTGLLTGPGEIDLGGGVLALDGGTLALATISLAGANMILNSGFNYTGSFLEAAGALNLNGFDAILGGTAQLGTGGTGGAVVSFAIVAGPGTLDVTGSADINSLFMTGDPVLLDNGLITDDGYLYFGGEITGFFGASTTDSAAMSIAAHAVFDLTTDSLPLEFEQSPITYLAGAASSIVNAGLFEKTGGTAESPVLPSFTNTSIGTITASTGDLRFTGGGDLAGRLSGAGSIELTAGTYLFEPGLLINAAGFAMFGEYFANPVALLSGISTLAGSAQFGEGQPAENGFGTDATIAGSGTLDIVGSAMIDSFDLMGGAELEDRGIITVSGIFDLGDDGITGFGAGSDTAMLSIAAGGVFDIIDDGVINNYAVINGDPTAASISNFGLFELTAGTSQNSIDVPFTNNGTVAAYTGTLSFITIADGAPGTLTGGTWEANSSLGTGATLALDGPAAINTDDARIILSGSGAELLSDPAAGAAIEQSLTSISADGLLAMLDGRGFRSGARLDDAGTIVLQGGIFAAPALSLAAGSTFAGYGTLTGPVTNDGLIEATDQTLTLDGDIAGIGNLRIDPESTLILDSGIGCSTDIIFGGSFTFLGLGAPDRVLGTLVSFAPTDLIELIGVSSITTEHFTNGILSLADGAESIALTFANPAVFNCGFAVNSAGGNTTITEIACFCPGTRILTADGRLVAIEDLRVGDALETFDSQAKKIIWLGRRTLDLRQHPRPHTVQPIQITAGSLGRGLPWRDLMVSPDHGMYLAGNLIPAKALTNGFTIRQLNRPHVTYYHVELAAHAVIFAEGAAAESYLETGNRGAFENGGPALTLHPDFAQSLRETKSCAPFLEHGPAVEAARQRILNHAQIATTVDPALHIRYEHGAAIIESRAAVPGELTADPRDQRRLGIKIASIRTGRKTIPLDHPSLIEGWHDPETDGRWTNGRAVIPQKLLGRGGSIKLTLAGSLAYPQTRQPTDIQLARHGHSDKKSTAQA